MHMIGHGLALIAAKLVAVTIAGVLMLTPAAPAAQTTVVCPPRRHLIELEYRATNSAALTGVQVLGRRGLAIAGELRPGYPWATVSYSLTCL